MNLRKLASSIPGFGRLLPTDWAWTLEEMTERIAQRVRCCARVNFFPHGCPMLEDKGTYKLWQNLTRRVLAINPDNADAWVVLGHSGYHLGQYELATRAYRVAVKFKNDPATWVSLGICTNRREEALDAYRSATELDPSDTLAWEYLGNTHAENGDHLEAITCFKKAIEISAECTGKAWPLCYLALSYMQLAKYEEAMCALEYCLRLDHGHNSAFDCMYPQVADACKGTPELAATVGDLLSAINEELSASFFSYYSRLVGPPTE
jgi:tetratricopeptide (TPR) repeat protein